MNNIIKPAKIKTFWEVNSLNWHIYKANKLKELFIKTFKDTTFRSDFKKSFYKSMLSAERISKKQMDIMFDFLKWNHLNEYENMTDGFQDYLKKWIDSFNPNNHVEVYLPIFESLKIQYISKKS